MKKFFAQLRPIERRMVVAALVIVILVLNWWYIWPHFGDWGYLHGQLEDAQHKLALYQKTIAGAGKYDTLVKSLENENEFVPVEDQAINFLRTIQSESSTTGTGINSMGHPITHTNEFFVEQSQSIEVNGTDKQLVNFLYNLGSAASTIRVLDLELQPDQSRMKLNAHVELVASYQKKPGGSAPASTPPKAKASPAKMTNSPGMAALPHTPLTLIHNPQP